MRILIYITLNMYIYINSNSYRTIRKIFQNPIHQVLIDFSLKLILNDILITADLED